MTAELPASCEPLVRAFRPRDARIGRAGCALTANGKATANGCRRVPPSRVAFSFAGACEEGSARYVRVRA